MIVNIIYFIFDVLDLINSLKLNKTFHISLWVTFLNIKLDTPPLHKCQPVNRVTVDWIVAVKWQGRLQRKLEKIRNNFAIDLPFSMISKNCIN